MTDIPPDPLDPEAPGLDEETRRRRRILADMRKMSPQALFELAVQAGIFTPEGDLTAPYKENSPSPYRDALSDSALDFPILDILRDPTVGEGMHYDEVVETLRRRWVVMENEVLGRLRRMARAGLIAEPEPLHFRVTDQGRQAQSAR
ncbi:uncharacterized protein SOCE26_081960 [Sorangium cellulosum]|uniref:Uncharacterized protein n=1 Tax=Sorangium cellulosum TaxID=56 RepID=A0A2L0F516_SORCE|nr:hypothetical protein [Sorangium cellulosum]AUX46688.1 uncharacterized protein SOCE26_081960 [Sorangium cellulosum]